MQRQHHTHHQLQQAIKDWFITHGAGGSVLALTLTTDPSKKDFSQMPQWNIDNFLKGDLHRFQRLLNRKLLGNNWQRRSKGCQIYAIREEISKHPHIHLSLCIEESLDVSVAAQYALEIWKSTWSGGYVNKAVHITTVEDWISYTAKHVKTYGTDAIYACGQVL